MAVTTIDLTAQLQAFPPGMRVELWNDKTDQRREFGSPDALVAFLMARMRGRGHYLLSCDRVTFTVDGFAFCVFGDYLLLHALAGVPMRGWPW